MKLTNWALWNIWWF